MHVGMAASQQISRLLRCEGVPDFDDFVSENCLIQLVERILHQLLLESALEG